MALPVFPTLTGSRIRRDVSGALEDNRIEFPAQVLSKSRSHSSAETEIQVWPYDMLKTDLDTVMTFWRSDLGNGNRMFTATDPYTDLTSRYKFAAPPQKGRLIGWQNGVKVFDVSLQMRRLP